MNDELRNLLAMYMQQQGGGPAGGGMGGGMGGGGVGGPPKLPVPGQGAGPNMPELELKGTPRSPELSGKYAIPMGNDTEFTVGGNIGPGGGPKGPVDWGAMLGLNKQF